MLKAPAASASAHAIYEFGDFRLDAGRRRLLLKADGRVLPLTGRAFDTLLLFVQHRGELLDKNLLMAAVWPNVVVEENNLTQSISAIRRVLGDSRDEHRFIVTVPGRGYRFVLPVQVISEGDASETAMMPARHAAAAPSAPATAESTDENAPAGGKPAAELATARHRYRLYWAGLAVACILVAIAVAWFVARRSTALPQTPLAAVPAPARAGAGTGPRLAVLPFSNTSPDAVNAFFADGLHEEILSALAERLPAVAVISRTTMMTFGQKRGTLSEVARQLGATHVMEGMVRREGNHVRLTLQLVDAATDRYLWTQSYDRTLASAMTLQVQVAADVASQLSVRLSGGEGYPPRITADPEAYDLYLRALIELRDLGVITWGPDAFHSLEDLLDRALQRDPNFALAHAQRARLHTLLLVSNADVSEKNVRSIESDLAAARERMPSDPVVLAASGYYLYAQDELLQSLAALESAEAAGLREVEWLVPKSRVLLSLGRIDEMVALNERMLSLDPADPLVLSFAYDHSVIVQRMEEAHRLAKLAAARFPAFAATEAYWQLLARGDTARFKEAVAQWYPDVTKIPSERLPDLATQASFALRMAQRYDDINKLLRRVPVQAIPFDNGLEIFGAVGDRPIAELRGWADLLVNDRARAAEDGRALLAFVAHQRETRWNPFYLLLLRAEAYTFMGQKREAIAAAHSALEAMPRSRNILTWLGVASLSARVYAWNGAQDDAVALLEQITGTAPGEPPGLIARDPLYTIPLSRNAGFQALVSRLEASMQQLAM